MEDLTVIELIHILQTYNPDGKVTFNTFANPDDLSGNDELELGDIQPSFDENEDQPVTIELWFRIKEAITEEVPQ